MSHHIALFLAERHIADLREDAAAAHRAEEVRSARRAARGGTSSRRSRSRRAGAFGMLAGIALMATASYAVASSDAAAPSASAAPVADPAAGRVEPNITVTNLSYPPGHTSGWHVHSGVHSVVVLAGVLTVFDEGCTGHDFGPGSTYLGGRQPHLARNDAADELVVAVTSVHDASPATGPGARAPVPAGCGER
jgi:quercetin dioxygenase-like cupin family protein